MVTTIDHLTFDPVEHIYRLSGIPVPSVTQVLRQSGYITFEGVPEKVLERARHRGQRVHQALHFLFEDDLDDASIDDEVRGYLLSAQRYLEVNVRRPIRAEFKVCSARHVCAGTLDLLAVHTDGIVSVDDFKTGQPDDVAADLQTSAYLGFLLEMASEDIRLHNELTADQKATVLRRRSIRLFRDGRIARETLYADHRDYAKFLTALAVVHDQARRPVQVLGWDDER